MLIPGREDFRSYLNGNPREDLIQVGVEGVDRADGAFLGYPLHPEVVRTFFKKNHSFLGAKRLALPPHPHGQAIFSDLLRKRKSHRNYTEKPVSFQSIAWMLQTAMGPIGGEAEKYEGAPRRKYPSAGALYAVDAYILVKNVNGLQQGTYYFDATSNELVQLRSEAFMMRSYLYEPPGFDEMLEHTAAAIILCGHFDKLFYKYGERAWKLAYLEAGHIAQNLYLAAAEVGTVGVCEHGGFNADPLERFLDLNRSSEHVLLPLTIGAVGGEA